MVLEKIYPNTCRKNTNIIFVFGDNLIKKGKAGQACIREEPNAFGVPTKRLPSMSFGSFFSDRTDEEDALIGALRMLKIKAINESMDICWPSSGIGTGLARMEKYSPILFAKMNDIIKNHFGNPYSQ